MCLQTMQKALFIFSQISSQGMIKLKWLNKIRKRLQSLSYYGRRISESGMRIIKKPLIKSIVPLKPNSIITTSPQKPLILYLTLNETTMSYVLGKNDDIGIKEQVIYYIMKKFMDYKACYSMIEKLCCCLVQSAKRLRQYFLHNTTQLFSKMDLFSYIFEKPYLSSRITKWQVLLYKYDIIYLTSKAVKGSTIIDHLANNSIKD